MANLSLTMWPFSTKQPLSALFDGFTDWHSHLLPGVDDGVPTMDETLKILSRYEKLGVKEVWLTPHIMEDIPNETGKLRERFGELQAAYHGSVTLHLSAENMLDNLFKERLENNDLLPLGENGDHLLVETSYFNPPMGLNNILLCIKSKGYTPVLAHPERYQYMDMTAYGHLKSLGIKFQLNLFSLLGIYGRNAQRNARQLLDKEYYNLCGTDLHSTLVFQGVEPAMMNKKILSQIKTLD